MSKVYIFPEVNIHVIQPQLTILFASPDAPEPNAPQRGESLKYLV